MASKRATAVVPDDVLFGKILPLLPFRSLCRFKLVSKAWWNTISGDRSFALGQSRRPSSISTGVINGGMDCFSVIPTFGSPVGLHPHTYLMCRGEGLRVLASCTNGLICCVGATHISVINPATGERSDKIIYRSTPRPLYLNSFALAFDPVSSPDRYKLINLRTPIGVVGHDMPPPWFDVFSSVTGEWVSSTHEIESKFRPKVPPLKSVYTGGVVYWDCYLWLLWFDVGKGVAGCSDLPVELSVVLGRIHHHELGVWGNRLTYTRCSDLPVELSVVLEEEEMVSTSLPAE